MSEDGRARLQGALFVVGDGGAVDVEAAAALVRVAKAPGAAAAAALAVRPRARLKVEEVDAVHLRAACKIARPCCPVLSIAISTYVRRARGPELNQAQSAGRFIYSAH